MVAAVTVAIVLATAALVVGIIDLTRSPAAPVSTAPSTAAAPPSAPADQAAADRALCTAIAPLMTESNRTAKAYSNSGAGTTGPKTPDQEAATTKFISDTKAWVTRIQPVIDSHPDADPFFRRSIQRFVDDRRYLIVDIDAGPFLPYDQTIWDDSLAALSGSLRICWDLGVKW